MGLNAIRCLGLNLACEYVPGIRQLVLIECEVLYSRTYTDAARQHYCLSWERKRNRTAI